MSDPQIIGVVAASPRRVATILLGVALAGYAPLVLADLLGGNLPHLGLAPLEYLIPAVLIPTFSLVVLFFPERRLGGLGRATAVLLLTLHSLRSLVQWPQFRGSGQQLIWWSVLGLALVLSGVLLATPSRPVLRDRAGRGAPPGDWVRAGVLLLLAADTYCLIGVLLFLLSNAPFGATVKGLSALALLAIPPAAFVTRSRKGYDAHRRWGRRVALATNATALLLLFLAHGSIRQVLIGWVVLCVPFVLAGWLLVSPPRALRPPAAASPSADEL